MRLLKESFKIEAERRACVHTSKHLLAVQDGTEGKRLHQNDKQAIQILFSLLFFYTSIQNN